MSHFSKIDPTAPQLAAAAPEFASILIVDDQRFDRKRLSNLCRAFAFTTHVIEADSLREMRDKLRKDRFDLILLDYHLTDGNGLEAVEAVRADAVNAGAAIVMITGTEQKDIAIDALKAGFSDYLTKDELSEETLTRTAITALQKSQLARGMSNSNAQRVILHASLQKFSRECAQDIKPIVSRIMRQMRELREIDKMRPEDAATHIKGVEGSLRRLWAFLDDLDHLAKQQECDDPDVMGTAASKLVSERRIAPARPARPKGKSSKAPSVFRR